MDAKKQRIQTLLAQSILIKSEQKVLLLRNLDAFDEAKIDRLLALLTTAEEKQDYFVRQALKAKPDLMKEVQSLARDEAKKSRIEKESAARVAEEDILSELDKELADLV